MSCDQSKIWVMVGKEIHLGPFVMAINVCIRDVTITVFAPNQHSLMLNIQPITIQYCFIIFSMYYCPIIVEQCTFSLKDTK